MALSEQEQRLLDEMERSLYQHDADFVSTTPGSAPSISARSITIAILAGAVGIGVVIAGMATGLPAIGLIGFALMIAGVAWALSSKNSNGDSAAAEAGSARPSSNGSTGRARSAGSAQSGDFMQRLEDRWDQRREGGMN